MSRMVHFSFVLTIGLLAFARAQVSNVQEEQAIFSWMLHKNSTCPRVNLLCDNKKCIPRSLYCNGIDDCGDNSDENYCILADERGYYRSTHGKRSCGSNRYIPNGWFCDGIRDCANGQDEQYCDNFGIPGDTRSKEFVALSYTLKWLRLQRKPECSFEKWGSLVDKTAVALYFADPGAFSNETRNEIAYEVTIRFLSQLARNTLQNISSDDLASFVNAFLVSCLDPRKFHGVDLVQELRTRVNQKNYTNPYVYLALCNAGETITQSDKEKLVDTFWNKQRPCWTAMQANVVMALACASKQPGNEVDSATLSQLTLELKQQQYENGSVENLPTTALVMQALIAAEANNDPDSFDDQKAMQQILQHQNPNGSFGNLLTTYYVLPVLSRRSLASISSTHCQSVCKDEIAASDNLSHKCGPTVRVQYSVWIGDKIDMERNLALQVPENTSFYGIMETAAEIDSTFSFEYVVKDLKPYVNAISGLQDNPEKDTYWYFYAVKEGKPSTALESPAEVIPKPDEHYAMWYRSGTWITEGEEDQQCR